MATIIKKDHKNRPWVVRYLDPAHSDKCQPGCTKTQHQREKSFAKKTGPDGAEAFRAKYEHDIREQIFVDPRVANERFRNAADGWLKRHTGTERTRKTYGAMLRNHILPAMGDKRLNDVARDREGLQTFLLVTMPNNGQGASQVRQAYMVVNAIVNDAIKSGKLNQSRIRGLPLPASPRTKADDFVFPEKEQIEKLAEGLGDYDRAVYLMRGCGLRISEALGVRRSDFRDANQVLRLSRQRAPDGKSDIPLKHRKEGEFRDVPVPSYVDGRMWGADDVIFPLGYASSARAFSEHFTKARDAAGIDPKFTPHSLRHVFASVALANAVPITDVSRWLGHRNIQTTYAIYSHFIPSSWERAREALDGEWSSSGA